VLIVSDKVAVVTGGRAVCGIAEAFIHRVSFSSIARSQRHREQLSRSKPAIWRRLAARYGVEGPPWGRRSVADARCHRPDGGERGIAEQAVRQ